MIYNRMKAGIFLAFVVWLSCKMTSDFFSNGKQPAPNHGHTEASTFSKLKEDAGTVVRPVLGRPGPKPVPGAHRKMEGLEDQF